MSTDHSDEFENDHDASGGAEPKLDGEFADVDQIDETAEELAGQELKFKVGQNLKFKRLDKYLCGRFSQFSRSRLQKLIKEQGVNVNGHPAKTSHKLNAGDIIDLILPPKVIRELIAEDIPINVIYEDDDIVVVNKQANLIVHPARGYKSGTLVNGLVYYFQSKLQDGQEAMGTKVNEYSEKEELTYANLSTIAGEMRPGIVHRLDRNTTGCMVVAKSDTAHWKLSRQFQDRTITKTYIALVHGVPELDGDCIDVPIGVNPVIREKQAVRADGKESVSFYQVLEAFRGYSLIQLGLKTGRTHQLRVHMAHIKHPIVADDMYGGKAVYPWQLEDRDAAVEEPIMGRVALHAWRLKFKHPVTDEEMQFEADLPPDMQKFLDELRQWRKI